MGGKPYFLGTHETELKRLEFQSIAWEKPTRELWRRAGIAAGQRVLDLGCGPGFCTLELSKLVGPEGRVISVDKSSEFLGSLRDRIRVENIRNVEVVELDIDNESLDIAPVDVIFVRWLHQYVDDLEHVLSEEFRCLKKGGVLAVHEVFHYGAVRICPVAEIFDRVTDEIIAYYARNRRDISVGARIPALLVEKGMKITSLESAYPIAQSHEALWEWYKQFSFSMLDRLIAESVLSVSDARTYRKVWSDHAGVPGAFVSTPAKVQVVARK